jgi:hypothetical protein
MKVKVSRCIAQTNKTRIKIVSEFTENTEKIRLKTSKRQKEKKELIAFLDTTRTA